MLVDKKSFEKILQCISLDDFKLIYKAGYDAAKDQKELPRVFTKTNVFKGKKAVLQLKGEKPKVTYNSVKVPQSQHLGKETTELLEKYREVIRKMISKNMSIKEIALRLNKKNKKLADVSYHKVHRFIRYDQEINNNLNDLMVYVKKMA
jgi:hypothetical protein